MSKELRSPSLSIDEVRALQTPLALDLVAAYTQMRDDTLDLVSQAKREGWTPARLLVKIEALLSVERQD